MIVRCTGDIAMFIIECEFDREIQISATIQ